ncbi:MAG: putative manganese transporter [Bacteroidales bacterium]|nr:arsenic efflux protein [Bacteroidales bacterium]MCR5714225.1 putative manganese transporter [Bacteroidales bacterium]
MIAGIIEDAVMVTGFVVIMMLFIECLNVYTQGRWKNLLRRSVSGQLVVAVLLGLLPGCLGGFAVVSLFTHGMLSFAAMTACMIATFGDEAFVLWAVAPRSALLLTLLLAGIALITGLLLQITVKRFPTPFSEDHWSLHAADQHPEAMEGSLRGHLLHPTWRRGVLLAGIALFAGLLLWNAVAEVTGGGTLRQLLADEAGLNLLFAVLCLVTFYIVLRVSDHFLEEHLWNHILKEHFVRIFLWTLGVVLVVGLLDHAIGLDSWVRAHPLPILFLAILIGLIPQSGPHLVFITLFAGGTIPLSVLLANSVVQEGHAGLPLLAESKKGFLWMKAVSVIVGLIVGLLGYFWEF